MTNKAQIAQWVKDYGEDSDFIRVRVKDVFGSMQVKSCAGIPTRAEQLDSRTALYSYESKYERTGGAEVTRPIIGGGFSLGGSGSCSHAIVQIVDGRVAAVNCTGDNDDMIGKEGICVPIFRGCLRAEERARQARAVNRAN